jgi:hypothetical protein
MFTDPVAQVLIRNEQSGDQWDFSPVGAAEGFVSMPFLTGVTIMYEEERMSMVTVNIDVPYEEGIRLIMTPPTPFAIGNLVQARIGYAGGLFTEWAVGHLQAGGDGLSVDPNGVTGSVNFVQASRSTFYSVPKDVPGAGSLADLLTFIAEYMGLTLFLGPKAQEQVTNEILDGDYALVNVIDMTKPVFDLLKDICAEENLRWMIGPNPYKEPGYSTRYLTIMKDEEIYDLAVKANRRKYVMRGVIDVENNQYPLLSWSPEGAAFATWLAETPNPSSGGVATYFTDTATGKVEEFEILPGDADTKTVGFLPEQDPIDFESPEAVADRKRDQEAAAELFGQPVKPGPDGKAQAEAKASKKQVDGNSAQTGVISTIGVPEEKAGNLCDVAGLGPVYDGVYKIRKVSHIWGPGTYDMSVTAFRYGAGGQEKSDGEQKETAGGQAT